MLSNAVRDKVKDFIRNGQKIQAIKYLKEQYPLSLKEAYILIETLSKEPDNTRTTWSEIRGRHMQDMLTHRIRQVAGSPASSINRTPLTAYIFAIPGIMLLFIALYFYWKDYQIARDSVTITGRVIELSWSSANHEGGATPVVEYTWKGKTKVIYGTTYSNPPAVEPGEKIEVIISTTNPDKVILNIMTERYFLMLTFGIMGLIFTAIGYAVFTFGKARK